MTPQVFDFADRHRGSYSDSLNSVVCPFYCSYSGYHVRRRILFASSFVYYYLTIILTLLLTIRMSYFGVHRGFTQPHRTAHTWLTSGPMATPWAQMMMTTPSVGMTNEPGPKFCFPRSCSNTLFLPLQHKC